MFSAHTVIRMLTWVSSESQHSFFTLYLGFSHDKDTVTQRLIKAARFYCDFPDTNAIIVEMEAMAAVAPAGLWNVAVF